jgi:hypothetical protein
LLEPALSLGEGQASQVLPVNPQQIERRVVQPAPARQQQPEIHPSLIIQRDYLALENGVFYLELRASSAKRRSTLLRFDRM